MHVPASALMVLVTQTRAGVNMLLYPSRFDKSVVDKEGHNKSQMQVRRARPSPEEPWDSCGSSGGC